MSKAKTKRTGKRTGVVRRINVFKITKHIPRYCVPSLHDSAEFKRGYSAAVEHLYEIL